MTAPTGDSQRTVRDNSKNIAFRLPLLPRLFSLLAAITLAGVSLFMVAFALLLFWKREWGLGLFMTLMACFMAALSAYVGRDLRARWGLHVVLEPDALVLDLPKNRSLIHHPPALHARIPYSDIEAIETRQEVYVSQFMGMMQCPYVLHRKNGELIFLFEDGRGFATGGQLLLQAGGRYCRARWRTVA